LRDRGGHGGRDCTRRYYLLIAQSIASGDVRFGVAFRRGIYIGFLMCVRRGCEASLYLHGLRPTPLPAATCVASADFVISLSTDCLVNSLPNGLT